MQDTKLGKYLTLQEFCTCTQTYRKYADQIDPYPKNPEETIPALQTLCQHLIGLVIDYFGREQLQLTYGFYSIDLKRYLSQKDPETGIKNGIVHPSRDQHMAHEKNRNGKYYALAELPERLVSVLPVIFGLWGWRAIASWTGLWNSSCRLIRCTIMGTIDPFISAMLLNEG